MVLADILMLTAIAVAWIAAAALLRSILSRDEVEALKRENRELRNRLKEEVESIRRHYEMLLKDAAVKNAIMSALYNAWKSGELKKCYSEGGEVRILADSTVLCSKESIDESYAINIGNNEEDMSREA